MNIKIVISFMLLASSTIAIAHPKYLVKHQLNNEDMAEIQLINQTSEALLCYVAIDGHKIRFRLAARQPSKWYRATDTRFNFKNFSTWCDYLSLHPKFQPKKG